MTSLLISLVLLNYESDSDFIQFYIFKNLSNFRFSRRFAPIEFGN